MCYTKLYKNTLRHVKTTTVYLYLEQELHTNEACVVVCVPLGHIVKICQ